MSLNHLEIESVSRCCLRRDMNDSVDVKRHVYLRAIAKLKVHAEFFFWRLCHRSRQQHINTRFGCRHTTKKALGRCRIGWYHLRGGRFNPGITRNFPDTDRRRTCIICLASANQICTFFKVTQLL